MLNDLITPPPADETQGQEISSERRKNVYRVALSDDAKAICRLTGTDPQQLVDRAVSAEVERIKARILSAMQSPA